MSLRLSSHTHAAVCGDDLVLLDVAAGSYACLAGCAPLVELSTASSAIAVGDPELALGLLRIGALEEGSPSPRFIAAPAGRDVAGAGAITAGAASAMIAALAWMARSYWRAPFGQLIKTAQAGRMGASQDEAKITELTRAFGRMLPWAPAQGACLYRSFYLLAFLRRHGLSASWVFGVQTYSFEAHCWLQSGDLVLDDHVEHVRSFAPILALEP